MEWKHWAAIYGGIGVLIYFTRNPPGAPINVGNLLTTTIMWPLSLFGGMTAPAPGNGVAFSVGGVSGGVNFPAIN